MWKANILSLYLIVHLCVLQLFKLQLVEALDNGVARIPPMGWSTWNTFGCDISEDLIKSSAVTMAGSKLKSAGYEYILLDDCWSSCDERKPNGVCIKPTPRDNEGRLIADPIKFPSGMKALAQFVHGLGLKIGIYTAVSAFTCQQYFGSLGFEEIDVDTFVNLWDFDFIKHDTCNTDCSVHNFCLQNSTTKMSKAIIQTGKDVVYYIDSGNPTSPMRVFNPQYRLVTNNEMIQKVANSTNELAYIWALPIAHMVKSWFDIGDSWASMLTNVHNSIHTEYYHSCGAYHTPDMLTVGMGGQSLSQYRVQFFLWAILGAPLLLGNDIRNMSDASLELVTSPEVISVAQDKNCFMGSMVSSLGSSEVWIKLLSDDTFAAVLVNKDESYAKNVTIDLTGWGDLYPVSQDLLSVQVRDIYNQIDLGSFSEFVTFLIPPMDAKILKIRILN